MRPRLVALFLLSTLVGSAAGVFISQGWLARRLETAVERALGDRSVDAELALGRIAIASAAASESGGDRAAELRALRDQLALVADRLSTEAARVGQAGGAAPPERPPAPTPEQEAVHRVALQTVADAVARGEWTKDDFDRFEEAVRDAPPAHQLALGTALSRAINEGRFRHIYAPGAGRAPE
jgi:hypothetical protein